MRRPPTVDEDPAPGVQESTEQAQAKRERKGTNWEPVSYNSLPLTLWQDLLPAYSIKEVFDITPLDGELAHASIQRNIGYVGVCFTDFHRDRLYERLIDRVLEGFKEEGNPLCNSAYLTGLQSLTALSTPKAPSPVLPTPKPKAGPKPKATPKATPKPTELDEDSDSDSGNTA